MFYKDRLNTLIHNDPRRCTRELANVMNRNNSAIVRRLHSMDKIQKSGVWEWHALSQNHKTQRVAISAYPFVRHRLTRERYRPFLPCIVTGDEK